MYYKKHQKNELRKEDMDLPTFDLSIISKATDNFSSCNKLGEGGYGPVYKVIFSKEFQFSLLNFITVRLCFIGYIDGWARVSCEKALIEF